MYHSTPTFLPVMMLRGVSFLSFFLLFLLSPDDLLFFFFLPFLSLVFFFFTPRRSLLEERLLLFLSSLRVDCSDDPLLLLLVDASSLCGVCYTHGGMVSNTQLNNNWESNIRWISRVDCCTCATACHTRTSHHSCHALWMVWGHPYFRKWVMNMAVENLLHLLIPQHQTIPQDCATSSTVA